MGRRVQGAKVIQLHLPARLLMWNGAGKLIVSSLLRVQENTILVVLAPAVNQTSSRLLNLEAVATEALVAVSVDWMEAKSNVVFLIAAVFDYAVAAWAMVGDLVHPGFPDAQEARAPDVAVDPGGAVEAA